MPARNTIRLHLPIAAALAALIGAACSASQPPAPPPAFTPSAGASAPASVTPAPSPLPSATASLPADLSPTPPQQAEGIPDVPYDMTGYELIAHSVGQATYSGYACVIAPSGCSCELPTIQQTTFDFTPDGALHYVFESDDSSGDWEMSRAAPNQWEYSFSLVSEERGGAIGDGRVLLSFTEEGFVYTQFINFYESGPVVCPEVPFRRLMSVDE